MLKSDLERSLLEQNIHTAQVLGTAVEIRDHGTGAHSIRVVLYAGTLGEALGLDQATMRTLLKGAFLHDVGKIGIPDRILLKEGKLTDEEFAVMCRHTTLGAELLDELPWFHDALPVVRHHHERYDGTGYPDGLRGAEIPIIARAFAIVDVFDALVSERPYKQAMPLADALAILEAGGGSHFDPLFLTMFLGGITPLYRKFHDLSEAELKPFGIAMRKRHYGV